MSSSASRPWRVTSRPRNMFWTMSRLSHEREVLVHGLDARAAAALGERMCTGPPFHRISPPSGPWIPAMVLMSTDLPAPLSPTSAVT